MGSGGASGSQTTTSTTQLPVWARGFAKDLLGSYAGLIFPGSSFANQLPVAQMPSNMYQQTAGFTPDQQAAMGMIESNTGAAQGLANAGAGNLTDTLNGTYLNPATNPYLNATFNQAAQNVTNQYQTATAPSFMAEGQMAGGGGPGFAGGSGFQQQQALNQYGLGQNLNNLATDIYGGNYQQERQNQLTGLGLLGSTETAFNSPANQLLGVGSLQQQQNQNVLNTDYQNAVNANQYPFQLLSGFGSILGQATGGSGSSISIGPPSAGGGK